MASLSIMRFLLAGLKLVPHSPGPGRAFSWWRRRSGPGLLALSVAGCAAPPGASPPLAYVPNEGSGTISIVDTATDTVTGEIKTGGKPRGLAFSRDGRYIYISDSPTSSLRVIDLAQ